MNVCARLTRIPLTLRNNKSGPGSATNAHPTLTPPLAATEKQG